MVVKELLKEHHPLSDVAEPFAWAHGGGLCSGASALEDGIGVQIACQMYGDVHLGL